MLESLRVLIWAVEQARPGFGEMRSDEQKAEVFSDHCRGAGHSSRVALYGRPRALRTCSPRAIGYPPVACDTLEAAFAIPRMCSYAVETIRFLQPCPNPLHSHSVPTPVWA